jgi:hypothetical protein
MPYAMPILRPASLAIGASSCTPAPYDSDSCPGLYVASVRNTPTCLLFPNDLKHNTAEATRWLQCVVANGC